MRNLSSRLRRQWLTLILASLLITLALNCVRGPDGASDLISLSRCRIGLIAENQCLRSENAQLDAQVARLRSDDAFIQRVIREHLGYARPDELVYRFHAGDSTRH